jgi:hypothetical protein
MNNPDHIFEILETIFCVKKLKFFDADPGSRMEKIRFWDPGRKKFGTGINIPDSQHWLFTAEAEPSGDYGKAEWAEHKLSMQREWERRRLSKALGLLPSQKHLSAVPSAEAMPQSINDGLWAATGH